MNVSLTPHLEAMIQEKVNSGRYASSSEVVRAALRLLEERDTLDRLRTAIASGQDAVARGEMTVWDRSRIDQIMLTAREAAAAGEKPDPDVCP